MTPKKSSQYFHTQKIFIFLKTKKNIEIQNFEPKKMGRAYVCMKISKYPPPPPPGAQARLSLHLSKCHIVEITCRGSYMSGTHSFTHNLCHINIK